MKYALSRESAAITGVSERLLREGWLRCWMSDHLRVRFAEAAISRGLAAQRGALIIPNDPSLDTLCALVPCPVAGVLRLSAKSGSDRGQR